MVQDFLHCSVANSCAVSINGSPPKVFELSNLVVSLWLSGIWVQPGPSSLQQPLGQTLEVLQRLTCRVFCGNTIKPSRKACPPSFRFTAAAASRRDARQVSDGFSSRFGRRRPFVLVGSVLYALCLVASWGTARPGREVYVCFGGGKS